MTGTIIGTLDLAMLSLYLFVLFFIGLVIYLQRENMREGYPLEDEKGGLAANQGPLSVPGSKTFKLPHGRGEVTVPSFDSDRDRDFAMEQVEGFGGAAFVPTGDPLVDGVGPAAWARRRDLPELDGRGHPKIVPMRGVEGFFVSAGRDPRGLPVVSADGQTVGQVTDMWVDEPEQHVRYVEYKLASDETIRLVPIELVRIKKDKVAVHSLYAANFANVPTVRSENQVTMLEEEKICAYYCGGKLYASPDRLEPAF
ncbi:photosynthetic reaction center subunit H [Tropicimonas sp. IMCC34043]|uniref:photosynthetic reaction center subunit H n=1 Tax=Tropicimonas sp. IMCC34043 TaxID=2248760 RepID=UPI000E25E722|nr:photosynthetic reaction center subunit H [Tropicimonas sp. IMCC34043]